MFLLGEDSEEWAQRLTEEEIQQLPIDIYWTGGNTSFVVDSKKTTELREYGMPLKGGGAENFFTFHFAKLSPSPNSS